MSQTGNSFSSPHFGSPFSSYCTARMAHAWYTHSNMLYILHDDIVSVMNQYNNRYVCIHHIVKRNQGKSPYYNKIMLRKCSKSIQLKLVHYVCVSTPRARPWVDY